jgi:hypothetical protein
VPDNDRNNSCDPHEDPEPSEHVANQAVGVFRVLLQTGTVFGGVHFHPRRVPLFVVIAVWLPTMVAVFSLVSADSAGSPSAMADRPTSTFPTTGMPDGSTTAAASEMPPVQPTEHRTVVVQVPGDAVAVMDGVRISVETVGFTSTHSGAVDCGGGGGNGPGEGGCVVVGGGTTGTSVVGVIDYSVLTPGLTCTVSSVHINESAVVSEPDGWWTRIVVLGIGSNDLKSRTLPVSFDVSRGHGDPVPHSPKVCVPR